MTHVGVDSARGLFAGVEEFPDGDAEDRFLSLVGIDELKDLVIRHSEVILNPDGLSRWAARYNLERTRLLEDFAHRPHLLIFSGDVGTGKTALAESFGDQVSRRTHVPITMYRLSLSARGSGAVGEMTQLLAAAFEEVRAAGRRQRSSRQSAAKGGILLVIDEADALAQSRELAQMHHEDRAGVNELIRGIDDLGRDAIPVLVVMCTNRLSALDPAIRRRAAEIFVFDRPDETQRRHLIAALFQPMVNGEALDRLTDATGPTADRPYGFTFSDIAHRLVSTVVLDAYPDRPVHAKRVLELAQRMTPTPPFESENS